MKYRHPRSNSCDHAGPIRFCNKEAYGNQYRCPKHIGVPDFNIATDDTTGLRIKFVRKGCGLDDDCEKHGFTYKDAVVWDPIFSNPNDVAEVNKKWREENKELIKSLRDSGEDTGVRFDHRTPEEIAQSAEMDVILAKIVEELCDFVTLA